MCKDNTSVTGNVKKPKEANLKPFTPMTAKQAAEASARARSIRKQMRAQLLEAAINDAKVGELYVKAFKTRDPDLMKLVETGLKIVGLTHDQSEEAVNRMHIDATTDNKTELSGEIKFVLPPKQ